MRRMEWVRHRHSRDVGGLVRGEVSGVGREDRSGSWRRHWIYRSRSHALSAALCLYESSSTYVDWIDGCTDRNERDCLLQ